MAIVGQPLIAPESGWQRLDERNPNITYSGGTWSQGTETGHYMNTWSQLNAINATIKFNFIGTKIRIIGAHNSNKTTLADIFIDGVKVETINQYNANFICQVLECDISGLSNKEHYVSIVNNSTGYLCLDAIDIDDTGELKPYSPVEIGNAILRVTMIDSSEREYRVSIAVIDSFVNWYTRTIGTGISCYAIDDSVDDSKEYLSFEKIISFKVIPLAK